ncbi:MAG: hypothetical protein WBE72_15800 [Terracidiphilus sp.]
MVVVPLSKSANGPDRAPGACGFDSLDWLSIAAAGTLAAGGALMVCGKPRAGLVTAASGTVLAMLDQQETVRTWWNALPAFVAELQGLLSRVQTALDDVTSQSEKLHKVLAK